MLHSLLGGAVEVPPGLLFKGSSWVLFKGANQSVSEHQTAPSLRFTMLPAGPVPPPPAQSVHTLPAPKEGRLHCRLDVAPAASS